MEEESRICCLADMGNELNLFCTVLHMDDAHKMYFCNDLKFIFLIFSIYIYSIYWNTELNS